MATEGRNLSEYNKDFIPNGADFKIGIVSVKILPLDKAIVIISSLFSLLRLAQSISLPAIHSRDLGDRYVQSLFHL